MASVGLVTILDPGNYTKLGLWATENAYILIRESTLVVDVRWTIDRQLRKCILSLIS